MPAQSKSIFQNEDTMRSVMKAAGEFWTKFDAQRTDLVTTWKVADYMANGAQNSTIASEERGKGANLDADWERANTGSLIFQRIIDQYSSLLDSIVTTKDYVLRYSPIKNKDVFASGEEAAGQAEQHNLLLKWNWKQDECNVKFQEFSHALPKCGNVPIMVYWNRKEGKRELNNPSFTAVQKMKDQVLKFIGYKRKSGNYITENWFTWRHIPVESLWADALIGNLQDQECVLVATVVSRPYLNNGVKTGDFDEDQVKTVTSETKYVWDGSSGQPLKEHKEKNRGGENMISSATDQYLMWDIFLYSPMNGEEWDEENGEYSYQWITAIGNDVSQALPIRFIPNPDPDEEIPIYMIHDRKGDRDNLYHSTKSQIVRSNYSVECTLKNMAIDNGAAINHPPLKIVEGQVRGTDFTYKPNATFIVDRPDSIQEMQIANQLQGTMQLLEWIQMDTITALSMDKLNMGVPAGSRTSALEISKIDKHTMSPQLMGLKYVLNQFLRIYGKKFISYWRKYKMEEQIVAVTDSNSFTEVMPAKMFGEFDIEINIIDEYEDDIVARQKLQETIGLVAQNPTFAEKVNIDYLLAEYFRRNHMDSDKIIKHTTSIDAVNMARNENRMMLDMGQPVQPVDGEDITVHLAEHSGELLRYKGLEDQFPYVELLVAHINATKAKQMQLAASASQAKMGPSAPAPSGNQGEGEAQGNAIAGAIGAARGQI